MMGKLMIDSVLTWARDYKVNGFRFDLMGHHSKQNMLDLRAALDRLTLRKDGVDGRSIYLYGEGWNFGEVADDALFEQATQANMAGTGIGTFTDRLRDAVRGGGPFDEDPRIQGFGSGLFTDPNGADVNGSPSEQVARLLHAEDLIKLGLAGNLADFSFRDSMGDTVVGRDVDYNGQAGGLRRRPERDRDVRRRARQRDAVRHACLQAAGWYVDGRPGADEHAVAVDRRVVPGRGVLARRHRPAALEVAGPQLLRLGGLVQPDRLDRAVEHVRLGPAAGGRQLGEVAVHATAAVRCLVEAWSR